jgi:hypothetical protein
LALAIATGPALGKRGTGRSGRSIWLFGIVPVLGFAADTLIELPAHGRTAAAAELLPVLLVGLLVQIPFALVAVALAVRILRLVERLAWALRDGAIVGRPVEPGALAWAPARAAKAHRLPGLSRPRAPPLAGSF